MIVKMTAEQIIQAIVMYFGFCVSQSQHPTYAEATQADMNTLQMIAYK